jgi:hypothetical protein
MANEITGKTGCAVIGNGTNTATLNITGWSVDPNAMEHRTDNTGGNGFSDRVTSIRDCKFTITANYDAVANIFDGPPAVREGTTLSGVKLYLQGTNGAYWDFPVAKVLGIPMESKVDDLTKYTLNCANKGTFTAPSGTMTASVS